jgi:prephenate dehydrogenase
MKADARPPEMPMLSVCVFGGGNGWGKRIAETVASAGGTVHIIEKDHDNDAALTAINRSDVVFIAIPDAAIEALLSRFHEPLKTKIILDCATNKTGFSAAMHRLANEGASICSTHPMAASGGVLLGQNALIMPIGSKAAPAKQIAIQIYRRLGMHCEIFDFNRHTELMVIVQMLPHVMQRLTIDVLAQGLLQQEVEIDALANLTSANYLLSELGIGRVAAQRADVSAGIIATALQEPFGQQMLERLQTSLLCMKHASQSREDLSRQFDDSVRQLDPSGQWRLQMADRTEAALIRLGNLRSRFLTLQAPNRIGMLRDILSVLAKHGIDMTALDSQLVKADDGSERVFFDIAISNEQVPQQAIAEELAAIGVQFNDYTP